MSIQATVEWHGAEAIQAVMSATERGLKTAAEHVLTEANKTIPLDQGPLQRSGGTDIDRGNLQASIYYGTPYARRQHEEIGWRHAPGRRAKWLELTLKEQSPNVQKIMATALKGAIPS